MPLAWLIDLMYGMDAEGILAIQPHARFGLAKTRKGAEK
jgi:hypothetical protein